MMCPLSGGRRRHPLDAYAVWLLLLAASVLVLGFVIAGMVLLAEMVT